MLPVKPAASLSLGDIIDLEGDAFADPNNDNTLFQCEYAVVCQVDRETPDCIAVYFEGIDGYGFPPDHLLPVAGHDKGYDQ